jgi:hypothetical protein
MAKVVSEKQINSFVKGLITEASPLTYPENSSLDEDNFELLNNGSRKRRLGIDYETGYTFTNTAISTATLPSIQEQVFYWPFPGGSTTVSLMVLRIYNSIYFYNLLASSPSSASLGGFSASWSYPTRVDMAVVNGILVIVPAIDSTNSFVTVTWDSITNTPDITIRTLKIRDFYGIYENVSNTARPATLTNIHHYNLLNQGWNSDKMQSTCGVAVSPIQCTYNTVNPVTPGGVAIPQGYPSNADIMSLGKIGATGAAAVYNKYDPLALFANSTDDTYAPKGHFIIDYRKRGADRQQQVSGLSSTIDIETGLLSTVAAYAGRAFYSGIVSVVTTPDRVSPNYSGYVFFSQTASSVDKLLKCYQENDPTSPDISDILATDGGTIHIPEASRIIKLFPVGQSLLVFAENGVWEIYGDTGGFTATSYQVSKVNSIGTLSVNSIVEVGGSVFYWAKSGIYNISPDPTSGRFSTQNISINTIQTLYSAIPSLGKQYTKVIYDDSKNVIRWLYNDSSTYSETNYINTYTKQLNLDLTLNAFSKYSFSNLDVTEHNLLRVCDFVKIPPYATATQDFTILAGVDTVVAGANNVVITQPITTSRESSYRYLVMKGAELTLAELNNTTFKDWVTADSVGVDYSSYLVTGYEYAGDIMREKQVPYVQFYFNRTEDGFTASGNDLVLDNQSGCLVQAQWNWSNSANSGKWGTQFQAYRLLRNYIPSGAGDTFDYGDSVIVTKNKLRGSGKVVSLKIQSETGKDMQLLGWAMQITGKSEV